MTVRAFSIAAALAASMLAAPAFAADTVTPATPAAPAAAAAVRASTASTTVAAPSMVAKPVTATGEQVPAKDAVKAEKKVDASNAKTPAKEKHHATKTSVQAAHKEAGVVKTSARAPVATPKAGTQVVQ